MSADRWLPNRGKTTGVLLHTLSHACAVSRLSGVLLHTLSHACAVSRLSGVLLHTLS